MVILIILLINVICAMEEFKIDSEPELTCRDRNRLIGTDKNDLYQLVIAKINNTIEMECHFCNELDDQKPKLWFYQNQLTTSNSAEVNVGMDIKPLLNKFHVTTSNTLIVRNITIEDGGLYYCHGRLGQDMQYKYNYLLDPIFTLNITPISGNLSYWSEYYRTVLKPANDWLHNSTNEELRNLREQLKGSLQVFNTWNSWSSCKACGRPQGQAVRTRTGYCRIKTKSAGNDDVNNNNISAITYETHEKIQEQFILNCFEFSCRSVYFGKVFPTISNFTKYIPNYVEMEPCQGECASDEGRTWKSKISPYKYKRKFILAERAHLTIICSESNMDSVVVWRKDGKELKSGALQREDKENEEPHIAVDTFSTLYLLNVTTNEDGNYTCTVDGTKMEEVSVFVVSKGRLLSSAFMRHMVYLGFVLSLTVTCYCAGLCIAWRGRKRFINYKTLIVPLSVNESLADRQEMDEYDTTQESRNDDSSSSQNLANKLFGKKVTSRKLELKDISAISSESEESSESEFNIEKISKEKHLIDISDSDSYENDTKNSSRNETSNYTGFTTIDSNENHKSFISSEETERVQTTSNESIEISSENADENISESTRKRSTSFSSSSEKSKTFSHTYVIKEEEDRVTYRYETEESDLALSLSDASLEEKFSCEEEITINDTLQEYCREFSESLVDNESSMETTNQKIAGQSSKDSENKTTNYESETYSKKMNEPKNSSDEESYIRIIEFESSSKEISEEDISSKKIENQEQERDVSKIEKSKSFLERNGSSTSTRDLSRSIDMRMYIFKERRQELFKPEEDSILKSQTSESQSEAVASSSIVPPLLLKRSREQFETELVKYLNKPSTSTFSESEMTGTNDVDRSSFVAMRFYETDNSSSEGEVNENVALLKEPQLGKKKNLY